MDKQKFFDYNSEEVFSNISWEECFMKNKITVNKLNEKLHFYLISNGKRYYLFTQDFSKGVYQFFKSGRSESELHKYNLWRKNPRLDKTIEKLPMYMRYVLKEDNAA